MGDNEADLKTGLQTHDLINVTQLKIHPQTSNVGLLTVVIYVR